VEERCSGIATANDGTPPSQLEISRSSEIQKVKRAGTDKKALVLAFLHEPRPYVNNKPLIQKT
jgi:hypothetical protein